MHLVGRKLNGLIQATFGSITVTGSLKMICASSVNTRILID
jgi:hypothetical protein